MSAVPVSITVLNRILVGIMLRKLTNVIPSAIGYHNGIPIVSYSIRVYRNKIPFQAVSQPDTLRYNFYDARAHPTPRIVQIGIRLLAIPSDTYRYVSDTCTILAYDLQRIQALSAEETGPRRYHTP